VSAHTPAAPAAGGTAGRVRLATAWLAGCSGCHMSFLDTDEFLVDLAEVVDLVYSPLADVKSYPEGVDVALVEGAVANEENLAMARVIRRNTRVVVAFGDCAVTGNVTALRNPLGDPKGILHRVYVEKVDRDPGVPVEEVPALLPKVLPLHHVIDVDLHLPGCPPTAARIIDAVTALMGGAARDATDIRFG
jgi:NAD-reducing hydrogenase small subunit